MFFFKVRLHIISFIKKFFLKLYFGSSLNIGKRTRWRRRFQLWIENGGVLEIGENCFFNNDCSITCFGKISIGDNSIFGENVKIYDQNHRFSENKKIFSEQGYSIGEVHIGKNCWIGSNVVILKGTRIGDNCVIGAGVVLSGEIKSNTIIKNTCNYTMEAIKGAENYE